MLIKSLRLWERRSESRNDEVLARGGSVQAELPAPRQSVRVS